MCIHYMILGVLHKQCKPREFYLKIEGNQIKKTHNQKLLGIHIGDKLSWFCHIDNLCSSISLKISLLRQLSEYVLIDVQKKLSQEYILP